LCLFLRKCGHYLWKEWNPTSQLLILQELTVLVGVAQILFLPDLSMQLHHPEEHKRGKNVKF
jgi:hypothetical protein